MKVVWRHAALISARRFMADQSVSLSRDSHHVVSYVVVTAIMSLGGCQTVVARWQIQTSIGITRPRFWQHVARKKFRTRPGVSRHFPNLSRPTGEGP